MSVLRLQDVTFSYGGRPLLEQATLVVERGERIALVGRNGTGKSTLLRLLAGELSPDEGAVDRPPGLRIARQVQDVPTGDLGTIFDEVAKGLGAAGLAVAAHFRLHQGNPSATEAEALQRLVETIDPEVAWSLEHRVEQQLAKMELDPWKSFSELSSGWKRRVLLARALVNQPDVLLLDEPTNHLDLQSIAWMEETLGRLETTLIFVTHDRRFLATLARRIIEIDRARLLDWTCNYPTFLERKEASLAAEQQQQALFDKKLAQEEVWIRQGVKARRTRAEGRVRALMEMRKERQQRRERLGRAKAEVHETEERSGALVAQTRELEYHVAGRVIVPSLTTTIYRGDKVGIIGPNGCGKTTLLRLLLGELQPTSGSIRHGTRLEIGYFDQLRAQLDEEATVIENVAPGQTMLEINGRRRHVISYLEDFLFTPERSKTLVRFLSGGERNRLLLARLLAKPTNLLVLDEPTNDLDAETMELLENLLVEYAGTVMLVSHDREFLNQVVTQTLVFEDDGQIGEYTGGYDDWVRQRAARIAEAAAAAAPLASSERGAKGATGTSRPARLSFKEERELEQLPRQIEQWEAEQSALQTRMSAPDFYTQGGTAITQVVQQLETLTERLEKGYARWDELEGRREAAG